MTTLKAFHEMMSQFLGELHATFPEEAAVKAALDGPKDQGAFDDFMKSIGPHASLMMAKSDDFFGDQNDFVKKLNLGAIWKSEEATPKTKEAIWQYLQTLYILGNTMSMFPPDTLRMIEAAAENCAQNMRSQGTNQLDERALMAGMNNLLSQMGGSPGALAGLMGAAQPQRRPKSKKSKK